MKYLSYGERAFLRGHLSRVRHVTLDPRRAGRRAHPPYPLHQARPRYAVCGHFERPGYSAAQPQLGHSADQPDRGAAAHAGTELKDADWAAINAQAVAATRKIYRKTEPLQIESDLQMMLDTLIAVARGKEPPLHIQPISLAQYAPAWPRPTVWT